MMCGVAKEHTTLFALFVRQLRMDQLEFISLILIRRLVSILPTHLVNPLVREEFRLDLGRVETT
jgi:hypothetical protein